MFHSASSNDISLNNILPNGLPLYAEDVIITNGPTKYLSVAGFSPEDVLSSGCTTSCYTSDSFDDYVVPANRKNSSITNTSFSEKIDAQPLQHQSKFSPWDSQDVCHSTRTCFEVLCSYDMVIAAVSSFLSLYHNCRYEYFKDENLWNCIIYKSIDSISFKIKIYTNENERERFVIHYQRTDGPCHMSQDVFRSLLSHCRALPYLQIDEQTCSLKRERSVSGQAAFDRLCALRNKPLQNVPMVSVEEKCNAVEVMATWLTTEDMTSLVRGVQCVAALLLQQSAVKGSLDGPLYQAVKRLRENESEYTYPLAPDILQLVAVE